MNIIKDLADKTMTEEKRKQAKNDFFAYYVGRPLSYVLTVPFLKLKVKPNTISFLSIIPAIIGFFMIGFGYSSFVKIIGWCMFFLWNLLDGVDGNVARYTKQFSIIRFFMGCNKWIYCNVFNICCNGNRMLLWKFYIITYRPSLDDNTWRTIRYIIYFSKVGNA